jgi:hypothetical protein
LKADSAATMKNKVINYLFIITLICSFSCNAEQKRISSTFTISMDEGLHSETENGRLILLLSQTGETEPRFSLTDNHNTQLGFGVDVENLESGQSVIIGSDAVGYPIGSLKDIQPGKYYAQAVFNRYKSFNLSTGHNVMLPPDKGEGQQWNMKPGNFYNEPVAIEITEKGGQFNIVLDKTIAPIEAPEDSKYIKHIKMRSEMLSEFWGEDVYLGAHVLLPEGFDEHPEARYPLMIFHGHFPSDFEGFRTIPPDPDLESEYSERFQIDGYNKIVQQEAYDFYKKWTGPDFPRMLIIEIQHPTPYYDDSYAVNSANQGPYGDAITYELIPYIEKQFRGIGEGWSRFLYGGSTGGWEALAAQVFYPDEYNACFAACPDPVDFRAYTSVNIYEDSNAYYYPSDFKKPLKPGHRDYLGNISSSLKDMNYREMVLGSKSRSGQQWDIWEATFSPQGDDGYPQPIWNKKTGDINTEVAKHWKENYDLSYILKRDWETLGPKLEGKIHIYCGDMDNYYLNNAVYLIEDFLESTTNPYYNGEVDYGDRAEHCWNGDHDNPNYISRLRYNTMYVPRILERIKNSAPKGADLTSWRY